MVTLIVHSFDPVVLVGASEVDSQDLNILQSYTPIWVAVDGGADHLLAAGIKPACVIGDLDSLSDVARTAFAGILHRVPEQDTVDFEKALSHVDAPLVFAIGFSGGRLDHTLAVLHVMGRLRDRAVIVIGADDVCAVIPAGGLTLDGLEPGSRISVMPLIPAKVTESGLRWPIDNRTLAPMGFTSPSNAVAAPVVSLTADAPVLLVLPKQALQILAKAMMG